MGPVPPGRIGYPSMMKLDTRNTGNPAHDNPSSTSPSNSTIDRSRYPPGPTEAGKSQNMSGKRPANSPIIPAAEKRPRIQEQRSVSAGNPADSRQTVNTAAAAVTSRQPSTLSLVDSMINPSRDPRNQGRAHAGSASPMHVASPRSVTSSDASLFGSGNFTPVHGASVAPPMVPSSVPIPKKSSLQAARGVASIRQVTPKKPSVGTVASENTTLASIRARCIDQQNQLKQFKSNLQIESLKRTELSGEVAQLRTEKSQLEDRLRKLEQPRPTSVHPDWSQTVKELSERVSQLEASRNEPPKHVPTVEKHVKVSDDAVKARLDTIEANLQTQESKMSVLSDKVPDAVQGRLNTIEASIKSQYSKLSLLPNIIPDAVNQRLNTIENNIKNQDNKMSQLSEKGPDSIEVRIKRSLEVDIQDLNKKYSSFSSWKNSIDDEHKSFTASVAVLKSFTNELHNKNSSYMKKSADLEAKLDDIVVKTDGLEKKLSETDVLAKRLDALNTLVDKNNKASNQKIDEMKTSIKKTDTPAANKKRFDTFSEKLNAIEHDTIVLKNAGLQKQLDDLKTEMAHHKEAVNELSMKSGEEESEKSASKLVQSVKVELEANIERMRSGIQGCTDGLERVMQRVDVLSESFNKLQDDSSNFKEIQGNIVENIAMIRQQAEQDRSNVQSRLDELHFSMADSMTKMLTGVKESIQSDLTIELQSQGRKQVTMSAEIEDLENQLKVGLDNLSRELRSGLDNLDRKMRSRTPGPKPSATPNNDFQEISDEVNSLSKEVATAMQTAEQAKNLAMTIGTNLVTTFEKSLEPKFDAIKEDIQAIQADVKTVREQPPAEPRRANATGPESTPSVPGELVPNGSGESANTNVHAAMQQIAKVEEQTQQQLDMVILAQKSLEERMQNVTTEDIYRQMVNWFSQTYPNPQNFTVELTNMRVVIDEIGKLVNGMGWMHGPERSMQLLNLAERCDLIIQFFEEARGHNFRSIEDLIVQGDEKLSREIQNLRTDLANERAEKGNSGINNGTMESHTKRLKNAESDIAFLNSSRADANNKIDNLKSRFAAMESQTQNMAQDQQQQQQNIARMRTNLAALNITAYEHQEAILAINHQLRGGGFKLTFSHDFKKAPEV